ncbi:LysR family transcriptional regulator [Modestobacter roseus]|uniref:DNA-binding transcriptional LysR family regulator n=1 Tax=Modestobacter roseus TaxID=1181884 RepID=A0A562IS53_9ACTN|nr:LysR family transcriptional regulator [Modestobacter roseus]MQA32624.1 LysR family transcriptional regulator [Modestobacter roseus]TWH73732.1 DNA-binding transcriptional LysR family regulator [Modestobacter roseus]
MTLTQLRTFALVARLGSLRAAAAELGVSEPAVSAALGALRTDLGDPLFVRAGGGIELTPGGQALAAYAGEIVGLADRARRSVTAATSTVGRRLRVLASAACEEHAAGPLIDAFTARVPGAAVDVVRGDAAAMATALAEDRCDLTLGVRPRPVPGVDSVPFLRYQRVLVAGARHPIAASGPVPLPAVLAEPWVTGPAGLEDGSAERCWAAGLPTPPRLERHDSEADALAAVLAGHGVLLALAHAVRDELRRGTAVVLPVAGTPVRDLWWVTVPGRARATGPAHALRRFLTTPDATTALMSGSGRSRPRPRPTVRVALWSRQ